MRTSFLLPERLRRTRNSPLTAQAGNERAEAHAHSHARTHVEREKLNFPDVAVERCGQRLRAQLR